MKIKIEGKNVLLKIRNTELRMKRRTMIQLVIVLVLVGLFTFCWSFEIDLGVFKCRHDHMPAPFGGEGK